MTDDINNPNDAIAMIEAAIDLYGADQRLWPIQAQSAIAQLNGDARVIAMLDAARLIDQRLSLPLNEMPSEQLRMKVLDDFASLHPAVWHSALTKPSIVRSRGFNQILQRLFGISAPGAVAGIAIAICAGVMSAMIGAPRVTPESELLAALGDIEAGFVVAVENNDES